MNEREDSMCNGFGHQLQLKVTDTHGDELVDIITVVLVHLPIATREEGGWGEMEGEAGFGYCLKQPQ